MKNQIYFFTLMLIASLGASAQKTRTIPAGEITSNTTWFNDTIYTLDGYVYVKNNAILTIQPGTLIKGGDPAKKSTLIVTRTGKLIAEGTPNQPIVFTSSKVAGARAPGDWGGIVILGQAAINRPTDCSTCPGAAVATSLPGIQNNVEGDLDNANGDGLYGGTDPNHNSGSLAYVRIEYGGVVITPGNEINGLTMGGVGKGTNIHHIQITQVNDDGFEWFGGNVDAKYLVSNRNIDDDLDVDFGFTGKVQFAIVLRDSNWYDIGSGPTNNGFESDNDASGSEANPYTDPTFSNVTVVGPLASGNPLGYSNSFQNGARIRRNSSTSIFNSIIMGWPAGLFVDGTRTGAKFLNDSMMFKNNILANLNNINNSSANASQVRSKVVLNGTDTFNTFGGILNNPFSYTNPNFMPSGGSAANSGASFSGPRISDAFFTPTTYRGAMSNNPDSNWTDCWCRFNPQSENYNSAPVNYPNPLANFNAGAPTGRTIVFTNNSSQAISYFWDFGVAGSSADTSVDANPTFVFPANGTYTVTLRAKNACGTSVQTSIVIINDQSSTPVANFTFTQDTAAGSRAFTFTNTTDEKGFATTYLWDFGVTGSTTDTSSAKNPSFTFPSNGSYQVKLVAIGAIGSDSITKTVNVLATSIQEKSGTISDIIMYPNPTQNEVNLNFSIAEQTEMVITVVDLTGKVLKQVDRNLFTTGKHQIQFSTSDLASGMYFVRMDSEKGAKTIRLVVVK
ncbi:MAG: PKD domain-containing protein [Bacteroidota bacterium]